MKKTLLALAASVLLLAACSSDKDDPKPVRLCPQVAILRELESVNDYGAAQADPAALVSSAKMVSVEGDCDYSDKGVDVNFRVNLLARRGPRLKGSRVAFPFFVSLVSPEGKILKKDLMFSKFPFGDDDKVVPQHEDLHVFIPVGADVSAEDYRVLLGFQLTEDQLKAVRDAEAAKWKR